MERELSFDITNPNIWTNLKPYTNEKWKRRNLDIKTSNRDLEIVCKNINELIAQT